MKIIALFLLLAAGLFAEESVEQLEKKITYHRNLYQNEGKREISDKEYDALISKLYELNPNSELFAKK